ncbi:Type VI secretion system, phage-baseplate injector [Fulvimarina manganoxydans]|uniref:Type VI secretion system, phage-baseplate injector n=1 Tax=Fulvimarina manganoxydans TaxID=937218 RepID=A0A1W1Z4L7_9HYPH|nr:phage baseplate assembly protein V [Fulvimarina manganoxydans]SMC43051.1 Type VI secretion system, phage-baseplate injector [Fulvimarina manganoxydans]
MSLPPDDILQMIPWLVRQKAEEQRRNRNRRRAGRIIEAKPAEGLYRVRFRDEDGETPAFDSPWLPVRAVSTGGLKIQAEPTIGQWVEVVSESGEMIDGWIEMSGFNDDDPRPHDKNGELAVSVSDGAYRQTIAQNGSETTKAVSRTHNTDGDIDFNTGGIVRFN